MSGVKKDFYEDELMKDSDKSDGGTDSGSSDSDTDDSGSDKEVEEKPITKEDINHWKIKVKTNPYDYESNIAYINILKRSGEVAQLLHSRESMSQCFPLTP
eukprot:Pgem_evm1s13843